MNKKFKLLKNFSIISLSAFTIVAILLSVFYRQKAVRELVLTTEDNNVIVAKVLANTLWPEYGSFLSDTRYLSDENLKNHGKIRALRSQFLLQLDGLSVAKVKVFDLQGRTVFSTDASQIGEDKSQSPGFLAATSGQVISQLDHRDSFEALDSVLQDSHLLSSYIPIYSDASQSEIVGVFELYIDVTYLINRIHQTQREIVLGSLLILTVLYIVLFLFVRRADYLLEQQYQAIQDSRSQYQQQAVELESALLDLRKAQVRILQSEKMSSLGQMIAGIAHEINNPVSFVHGNLSHVTQYAQSLLSLIDLYQTHCPNPHIEIQEAAQEIDLEFIRTDFPKILSSMRAGSSRIRDIILALRIFSRLDESEIKSVDIHQGLESTLMLLSHRLRANEDRPEITLVKNYGQVPIIECYAGLLNQVFMHILTNALDALDTKVQSNPSSAGGGGDSYQITLSTRVLEDGWLQIAIADNGFGISPDVQHQIFDPFFTTKEIGQGTGMGLSISHQIITERHQGHLECISSPGEGTEFVIQLPLNRTRTAQRKPQEASVESGRS